MSLKKFRDWVIELKLYFTRTYSYLNILNFLMIVLIFLNTTIWEYDVFQKLFPDRKLFLITGLIVVLFLTVIIGILDTRYKFWRTENERNYTPDRNPLLVPLSFQCAKMISDLKASGKDTSSIETELDALFERCALKKQFEMFKEATKRERQK